MRSLSAVTTTSMPERCSSCKRLEKELRQKEEEWKAEREKLLVAIRRESEQWDMRAEKSGR
jgi:hypothetical protein